MKLKEKIKRFWTLDVHNHEGFTLVELIIVIAILAILSSVAVVGYSSYIKKANMQADRTLAAEVENALMLAFYSEGFDSGSATVILTTDGAYCADGATTVDNAADAAEYLGEVANKGTALACALKAMSNAYGDNWFDALKLKYDGWKINSVSSVVDAYNKSTFNGEHDDLLQTVQTLTNQWMNILVKGDGADDFVVNLVGNGYDQYLKDNGVDTTDSQAVANTAVTYVSYRTNLMDATLKENFKNAWVAATDVDAFINACKDKDGKSILGTAGSMAALYAKAEALVRFMDKEKVPVVDKYAGPEDPVCETWTQWLAVQQASIGGKNANQLKNSVDAIFLKLAANIQNPSNPTALAAYQKYSTNQAKQDADAYLQILGVIDDSSSVMLDNLGNNELYGGSICNNLLNGYLNLGANLKGIAIENGIGVVMFKSGNECVTTVYPLDYEK